MSWVLSMARRVRAEVVIVSATEDVRREDVERLKQQIEFLLASFDDDPPADAPADAAVRGER
jgi:hypothetical protein